MFKRATSRFKSMDLFGVCESGRRTIGQIACNILMNRLPHLASGGGSDWIGFWEPNKRSDLYHQAVARRLSTVWTIY